MDRDNSVSRAKAVTLFPIVAPGRLQQSDLQHNISQFGHVTATVVSLECKDGYYDALRLLELGEVFWQTCNSKSDPIRYFGFGNLPPRTCKKVAEPSIPAR